LECVFARLDEGCGEEMHCGTCAIRNAVNQTEQTGESLYRVECYVERDTGREPYLVSTVKLDSSVQVVFESAEAEE
jgi:hypothetical protein